jgi:hypothetical protein
LLSSLSLSLAIPLATLLLTALSRQIFKQTQSALDISKELINLAKTYKDKTSTLAKTITLILS